MPAYLDSVNQYVSLFKDIWDVIDDTLEPKLILGNIGYQFVHTWAIKGPLLPFFMNLLAILPALANGAKTAIFPAAASPLFLIFLNVNFLQTRKSACTGMANKIGEYLDERVENHARHIYDRVVEAEDTPDDADSDNEAAGHAPRIGDPHAHPTQGRRRRGADSTGALGGVEGNGQGRGRPVRARRTTRPAPILTSSVMQGATREGFFQRWSGNFPASEPPSTACASTRTKMR